MSLGRGLGALIPSPGTKKEESKIEPKPLSSSGVLLLPLVHITPNPDQPRKVFKEEELQELANSIREHGVLQPILVVKKGEKYEIVAGERRFRAAKLAGLNEVPAVVKEFSAEKRLEASIIENIQREDLNPIEEARAYEALMQEFDLTQEEVARKVGKSRSVVANMLRLLTLPKQVQEALGEGKISMSQGRSLLTLKNADEQLGVLASMLGQKITVRELEKKIASSPSSSASVRRDPDIVFLENQLRSALGARVSIFEGKNHQGTVTVHFHSREELNDVMKKIV